MRQLPLRGPIQRAVRNRQEIRAAVLVLAQEAYTPEEWETERKAMVQWGLLSPDFPLKDYVLELLTEQAAGYYDPKQRMFFIADWLPQLVQKPVMAHELVHALQDQHYNLQKNFDLVKDHADLTLARKALIEGDATAAMFLYLLEPIGLQIDDIPDMQTLLQMGGALLGEQFQVYNRAPLILRQQLLFPYVHGLAFVKAALARGGWPGLRRVYQRPPVSTQHILHPETYFAEPPVLPQDLTPHLPDDLLGSAWSKRKRDTLGEFLLSVVLQQFLPEDEARQSVVGWRGDHYVLFEQPDTGRLLLVSVSAWESPKAAHAFFQSYSKLLAVKYPGWTQQPLQEAGGYVWHQDTKRLLLRQQHRFVQIIEGAQQEDLLRLQPLLERVAEPSAQPR
ncbi:MAG: hypothetical protein FJZ47_09835 [Candidatus Tectomicrobia bacterium]|uniref:Uncharacterized protein n=1 Tax=Tectimicrobiota bacterium TaxID=2528274 RepID=A0A937VZK5_UNCTE|nr:hypothetical protein [Candidatus Tectomicrobia bacterium]